MEALYIVFGLAIVASTIYLFVAQYSTIYKDRTPFQKVVTWFAMVCIILIFIGIE